MRECVHCGQDEDFNHKNYGTHCVVGSVVNSPLIESHLRDYKKFTKKSVKKERMKDFPIVVSIGMVRGTSRDAELNKELSVDIEPIKIYVHKNRP